DVFKNEPMDFEPGEKFLYNNSGYILLGHIIEVASGQSYEDFIEKNIFSKIGMENSYYGSMKEIIENRAYGYQLDPTSEGYVNAEYLSLTIPYAAGSIMSTVDDLLKWQNALSANKFVKRETLNKAINGSKLNDGTEIPYGYGWGKGEINGSKAITHSGGIFGYTSNGIYLPNEDIYVVGLSNCNCKNISQTTMMLAAEAIGKPFPSLDDTVELSESQLKKWVGAYEFEDENAVRFIQYENGKLTSLREGSETFEIHPLSENRFVFDDVTIEYSFKMENGKKMVEMKNNGTVRIGKFVDKAPPSARKTIDLSVAELKTYEGNYQLNPMMTIKVFVEDETIYAQLTGQPKIEIFPESKTLFFLKAVPAELEFHANGDNDWKGLTLRQGGQQMEAAKVE
ncbi:MAG: serine hydrolase, partial [Flavobacteriaceae bacterium]|nr:serine hydrolase [Flavobacteriaceae bacterium]